MKQTQKTNPHYLGFFTFQIGQQSMENFQQALALITEQLIMSSIHLTEEQTFFKLENTKTQKNQTTTMKYLNKKTTNNKMKLRFT